MDHICKFLDTVKIARKQSHLNLAVFTLLAPDVGEPDYLILEEALKRDFVEVTEVSEGGSVPDLRLINRSIEKILVVDGEELIGAKQNRIVNATFLIAGKATVVIPVSCVEQGRWVYRTRKFDSGDNIMPSNLRHHHMDSVYACLASGLGYRSNQSMIWDDLSSKAHRLKVNTSTGAMADLFVGQEDRLEEYLKAFRVVDCQVGSVFAINGEVVGLECFGYQKTFGQFVRKLVRSYAPDAIEWSREGDQKTVSKEAVRHFLEDTVKANTESYPSLGLGENVRLRSRTLTGSALQLDDRVVHLAAFKSRGRESAAHGPHLQRFSQRSRRYRGEM